MMRLSHLFPMFSLQVWLLEQLLGKYCESLHILCCSTLITNYFSFVTGPMELVKIQLQNQTHTTTNINRVSSAAIPKFTGPIDCLMKIYHRGGIRACYAGLTPTVLREVSFGPYFVTFEVISRLLRTLQPGPNHHAADDDLTGWQVVLAGGSAGIMAWCSTYAAGNVLISLYELI